MGMIRGKVWFGDGGRGLAALGRPQHIVVGESPWRHCAEHNKYYDRKTGEEVKVEKMSLEEFLKKNCQLPCCAAAPVAEEGE